jgi:hypothetical protein
VTGHRDDLRRGSGADEVGRETVRDAERQGDRADDDGEDTGDPDAHRAELLGEGQSLRAGRDCDGPGRQGDDEDHQRRPPQHAPRAPDVRRGRRPAQLGDGLGGRGGRQRRVDDVPAPAVVDEHRHQAGSFTGRGHLASLGAVLPP